MNIRSIPVSIYPSTLNPPGPNLVRHHRSRLFKLFTLLIPWNSIDALNVSITTQFDRFCRWECGKLTFIFQ